MEDDEFPRLLPVGAFLVSFAATLAAMLRWVRR